MYLPKNLIITDLYTEGGIFRDADGKSYRGYYFSTKFGTYYKGKNPNDISFTKDFDKKQLFKVSPDYQNDSNPYPVTTLIDVKDWPSKYAPRKDIKGGTGFNNNIDLTDIDFLNGRESAYRYQGGGLTGHTYYSPISIENFPTEEDYVRGYFTRYFCVKVNENEYYEIFKQTYDDIITQKPEWSSFLYVPFKMLWYIKGDMVKTQTLNKELVGFAEQKIQKGEFGAFLKEEYLKFFRISPGVNLFNNFGLRTYLDNKPISVKLPKAYQLGNSTIESINPNVPAKQNCSNCIFNKSQFCTNWKANIRKNYWCKSYKGEYGEGKILGEVRDIISPQQPSSPQPTYSPPSSTLPPSGGGGGY